MEKGRASGLVLAITLIALTASYIFWRDYHEERSIGGALVHMVLGFSVWGLIFAFIAFVQYLFRCRGEKSDSGMH
jgi:hypothetical protein